MRSFLALAGMAPVAALAAAWTVDLEGARLYDDNLSRAQRDSDRARDRAWTGRAALGRAFVLGEGDATVHADVRAARHDRFSGLDHDALGAGASWRRKLGLGLTAPWIALEANARAEQAETAVRDSLRSGAAATLGKRFDERWEASLRAGYDRRRQREAAPLAPGVPGNPFSLQGRSITLGAGYAFSARGLVYASAGLRRGDVVSSTRRNAEIFRESAALAADPAFGADFVAYRLTGARSRSLTAGLSWALGRRAAFDAAVTRELTAARGGLDYDGNLYSLSLVYRD
jgi:hypothetical protein